MRKMDRILLTGNAFDFYFNYVLSLIEIIVVLYFYYFIIPNDINKMYYYAHEFVTYVDYVILLLINLLYNSILTL